jgi:hypothetical protein
VLLWLLHFGGNSKSYMRVDKPSPSQAEIHKKPRSPTKGRLLPVDFGSCDFMLFTGPQRSASLASIVNLEPWHHRSYLDFLFSTGN